MPEVSNPTICCQCHVHAVWLLSKCGHCYWCDNAGKKAEQKKRKEEAERREMKQRS